MPYIEVTEEQLKEFDPEGKLKIYKPEDVSGLKENANSLLREKKTLESDLAAAKADLAAAKIARLPNDGDAEKFASQLEDAKTKISEWEVKYNGLEGKVRSKTIESEAMRIAAGLTKDTDRANLLKQQLLSRLTLDGDKFSVLDENGSPTISSIEELTSQIKTQYPFLVDGSQASGGGAQGGSGGAGIKPVKDMSMTERAKFANESPLEYSKQIGA